MSINLKKLSNKRTLIYGWVGAFCEDFLEKSFSEVTTAGGWWLPFRGVSSVWPPEECSTLPQQENFLFNKDISLFFLSFIQRWLNSIIHICSRRLWKKVVQKQIPITFLVTFHFLMGGSTSWWASFPGCRASSVWKVISLTQMKRGNHIWNYFWNFRFEVLYDQLIITSSSFR